MSKGDKAKQLFLEGYNCSQSVVGAFADELNIDFDTAMKMTSSFGGGMGRMREVCGAVSGMCIIAGLKYGYSDPKAFEEKAEHYKRIQELAEAFKQTAGKDTIVCRELLGLDGGSGGYVPEKRTDEYYKKRPCPELIKNAADCLEKYINSHNE